MGKEDRAKVLTAALVAGSLLIIGVGLAIALSGAWFGWVIAAAGLLEAITMPFVLARIGRGRRGRPAEPTAPQAPTADPTADPSYNPYARED